MFGVIVLVVLLGLLLWGLEHNHRRGAGPPTRLAGSTSAEDRDLARLLDELRHVAARRR